MTATIPLVLKTTWEAEHGQRMIFLYLPGFLKEVGLASSPQGPEPTHRALRCLRLSQYLLCILCPCFGTGRSGWSAWQMDSYQEDK
jgi:hypothetical protein